jgi:very-short-patch-repair endonuclease
MTIKHNSERDPERIEFARDQRKQSNEFAQEVWQLVRAKRLLGEKFRREHPVGPYTLDFACLELMLDLEIDGKDHLTEQGRLRDVKRDAFLRSRGFGVLRISGFRVTQDLRGVREEIEGVVRRLRAEIGAGSPSPPAPLPEAGRGEPESFGAIPEARRGESGSFREPGSSGAESS